MVSFTYCVSRYNDKTALSVFVSLHISHPEPRWRLMWDKRLSSDREGSYRNTTLVAAVVACRAASYTRKSTSTSMAWRTEGTRRCGPWNNRAKRKTGPSSPQRREVSSISLHARSAHAGSSSSAPRSDIRALGSLARCRRRGAHHRRAQSRDGRDCPEEHGEDRRRVEGQDSRRRRAGNSERPQRSFRLHLQRHRQGRISRSLGPRDRAPSRWWTPRDGQRLVGRRCGPERSIEGDAGHPDLQRTAVEGPADDRRDRSASGWRLRHAEGSRVGRPSAASAF